MGVQVCSHCNSWTVHTRTVSVRNLNGDLHTVIVRRCMNCDGTPCEKCTSKTLDPTTDRCPHCKTRYKMPKVKGA